MSKTSRTVPLAVRIGQRLQRVVETQVVGPVLSPLRPGNVAMFHIGRSGSTVLADLLAQHPRIFWDGEVYERMLQQIASRDVSIHEVRYPVDLVEAVRKRMKMAGRRYYGFEVKFFHLLPARVAIEDYLERLERHGFDHFIVLERKNYLRKIVSSLIAKQIRQYHLEAAEKAALRRTRLDVESIQIDRDDKSLLSFLEQYDEDMRALKALLSGRDRVLHLTYEDDIQKDPQMAYRKVCAFLGVQPLEVDVRRSRTNPFPLHQMLDNFQEVTHTLRGTRFEWMLDA